MYYYIIKYRQPFKIIDLKKNWMHLNVFDFDKASNKKISLFVHKFNDIFLHF